MSLFQRLTPKSYILPLHKRSGSIQFFTIIALMTAMLVIIGAVQFSLLSTVHNWKSLIEHQASIEIPALDQNGRDYSDEEINMMTQRIIALLENIDYTSDVHTESHEQVAQLIGPWLGENNKILDNMRLPVLVNFNINTDDNGFIEQLTTRINKISPRARLQTHKNWLNKFLKIVHGVHGLGLLIIAVTVTATLFVISSTVRSRMAIYKKELALIHIMGAHDRFILRQFLIYLGYLVIPAAFIGALAAFIMMSIISALFLSADTAFIPSFGVNGGQFFKLLFIPLLICIMSISIGAYTVIREMKRMP
ncbi:MAG: hypothetical protein NZ828_02425 [Alphaproteobacteria bacterium]|nr:hypothetical protein [Alphaproteobacteria bacterium]